MQAIDIINYIAKFNKQKYSMSMQLLCRCLLGSFELPKQDLLRLNYSLILNQIHVNADVFVIFSFRTETRG